MGTRRKRDDEIIAEAQRILEQRFLRKSTPINWRDDTLQFLRLKLLPLEREAFIVIFLDNKRRVIDFEVLFYGTVNATVVYPREVVRAALRRNSAALIVAHNHPSGAAKPSQNDFDLTERLQTVLNLVEVRLIDHLVIGDTECVSIIEGVTITCATERRSNPARGRRRAA